MPKYYFIFTEHEVEIPIKIKLIMPKYYFIFTIPSLKAGVIKCIPLNDLSCDNLTNINLQLTH